MIEQRKTRPTTAGKSQATADMVWAFAVLMLALTWLVAYVLRAKVDGLTPFSGSGKANSSNDLPARVDWR